MPFALECAAFRDAPNPVLVEEAVIADRPSAIDIMVREPEVDGVIRADYETKVVTA